MPKQQKKGFPWPIFVAAGAMGLGFWYIIFKEGEHQDGSDLWTGLGFPYGPIGNLPAIGSDFRTGANRTLGNSALPVTMNLGNWQDIYTSAYTGVISGWAGYNVREVLPPASLKNVSGSVIRVTISVNRAVFGSLDSLWIGPQGSGNLYNFDGTQQQLTFGGNKSLAFGNIASSNFVTDPLPNFPFSNTIPLVIAMHFTGAGNIASNTGTVTGAHSFFLLGADVSSQTTPAGVWTDQANQIDFVSHIEYSTSTNILSSGTLGDVTGIGLTDVPGALLTDIGSNPYGQLYPSRNAAAINIGGNPSGSPPP